VSDVADPGPFIFRKSIRLITLI